MKLNKLLAHIICIVWFSFTCCGQSVFETSYRIFGKGQPLLIINGGPGMNSEGFESLAKLLMDDVMVILYDQRGTGKSTLEEVSENTITMDAMVNDIENLRMKLNLEQWHVLGHSFGGMLASYYTSKFPDKIKSLVLSSSGGINLNFLNYIHNSIRQNLTDEQRKNFDRYNTLFQQGDTTYQIRYQRALNLAAAYLVNDDLAPIIGRRLLQIDYNVNSLVIGNMQNIKFDCSKALKNYAGKVLIIQGREDIIKEETAHESFAAFTDAKLTIIDGCAHYCWLEKKDEYINAVKSFLKALYLNWYYKK